MPDFTTMIGKKLKSVELSDDKEKITFRFLDGTGRSFGVEGDCCSSSWIEHLEKPAKIMGAVLTGVEDSGGIEVADPDHECLQVYSTKFGTTKGDIVLEYRNSSNGYYGGYLVDASTPDEEDLAAVASAS